MYFIIYKFHFQKILIKNQIKTKHKHQNTKLPTRVIQTPGSPQRKHDLEEWPTRNPHVSKPFGMRLEAGLEAGRGRALSERAKPWCHGVQAPPWALVERKPSSWASLPSPPLQECSSRHRPASWGLTIVHTTCLWKFKKAPQPRSELGKMMVPLCKEKDSPSSSVDTAPSHLVLRVWTGFQPSLAPWSRPLYTALPGDFGLSCHPGNYSVLSALEQAAASLWPQLPGTKQLWRLSEMGERKLLWKVWYAWRMPVPP